MPQKIIMSEEGMKDIDKLEDIVGSLMNYGILHEDMVNTIDEVCSLFFKINFLSLTNIEETFKEYEEDFKDIDDFINQECGSRIYIEYIDNLENKDLIKLAKIYRDTLQYVLSMSSYQDSEDILKNILSK